MKIIRSSMLILLLLCAIASDHMIPCAEANDPPSENPREPNLSDSVLLDQLTGLQFDQAKEILDQREPRQAIAWSIQLASSWYQRMAPDQMRSYISYALGLAQKHDLRAEEAEIWFFRTTLSLASHDLAGALSLIDEVIARASQCGHTNLLKQGMGLKGNTLERQGRYHDAVDVYQELARFADTIGDGLLKSECIYSIANLQHKMGHENLSKESLHEAIRVYEKEAYPQGKANCLKLLGVYAADESRNVEALGYYTEAARLYEETGDWVGYGNCFHNLGLLYREGHENETALGYFMEALAAYTSAASLAGVGIAHMESGRTYFMMNNYAAAEISFTLAETFLVKGQALARLAGLNSYMGDLKAAQGMNEKAAGYYTKSISLYEEVGLRDDAASQRMNLLKVRPITSDRKAR